MRLNPRRGRSRRHLRSARALLDKVASRIAVYAGDDAELKNAIGQLRELARQIAEHRLNSPSRKEVYYSAQISSRGQRDKRS